MTKLGFTRSGGSKSGRTRRRLRRRLSGGVLLLIALTIAGGLAAVLTPTPQVAVADTPERMTPHTHTRRGGSARTNRRWLRVPPGSARPDRRRGSDRMPPGHAGSTSKSTGRAHRRAARPCYTEVAAARKLGLPDDRVAAWEVGEVVPTIAQLRKAAEVYKRSLAVFFLSEPPEGFDTLRDFRRLDGACRSVGQHHCRRPVGAPEARCHRACAYRPLGDRCRRHQVRQINRRREPVVGSPNDQPLCLVPVLREHITWEDPDTVLLGTDFGGDSLTTSGYPRVIKRWRRGKPLADAETIFEGAGTDVRVNASADRTPGFERWRAVAAPVRRGRKLRSSRPRSARRSRRFALCRRWRRSARRCCTPSRTPSAPTPPPSA